MRNSHYLSLGAALAILSCTGDTPTAIGPGVVGPSLRVAGNSGCYTVQGTISEIGIPPNFAGTIDGDLEGTTVTQAPGAFVSGVVFHTPGAHTYTITGGTVPEHIGQTLQVASENTVVFTQDNPAIGRINSTQRVQSPGSGNLTVHGSFDFTTFPPAEVELEYHGMICP